MLALFLTLALSAGPEVGIAKRSSIGVPDPAVAAVLAEIREGLERQGLGARALTLSCGGEVACLASAARDDKLQAVLGVTILRGRKELAVDLEAIDPQQHALGVRTFGVPFKGRPFPADGEEFFRALKRALTPPVEDAPRVVELTPQAEPTPQLTVRVGSTHRLLATAAVTTAAVSVLGIGLAVAGGAVKANLDGELGRPGTPGITRGQAESRAGLANGLGTGAILSFAIAGAAAIATGVLLFQRVEPVEE